MNFEVPGDPQSGVCGMGAAGSGEMVKLHFDPLGDDIVWVSAHSAIFEAGAALQSN